MIPNDLISLIVPIYKVDKYLDRCVESLVNQTYKNIEIILVDDGSPDNSGQLAENWKKRDGRVVVFHKSNGGLSSARNFGIRQAKGKYIGFVDSDDFVAPSFVEALYTMAVQYGVNLSAVGFRKTVDSSITNPESFDISKTEIIDRYNAVCNLFYPEKYGDYAWNKLYLRDLFSAIEFPEGRMMEDLGTCYLLLESCESVAYNPGCQYYYFQRNDSILHLNSTKFHRDKYAMCKERYLYLKDKYPDMYLNYEFFCSTSMLVFAYQSEEEKCFIKKELKKLWPQIKKTASLKVKVKYFFCTNMNELYSKFCRTKHHYQDLFRRLI